MLSLDYEVGKVVETLEQNRDKHVSEYEDAKRGWVGEVNDAWERVRNTQLETSFEEADKAMNDFWTIRRQEPKSYKADYDHALAMLKFGTDNGTAEVRLDEESFRNYILDEWHWKESFAASTMNFGGKFR